MASYEHWLRRNSQRLRDEFCELQKAKFQTYCKQEWEKLEKMGVEHGPF